MAFQSTALIDSWSPLGDMRKIDSIEREYTKRERERCVCVWLCGCIVCVHARARAGVRLFVLEGFSH